MSVLVGYCLECMFCKLVAIEMRISRSYVIYGFVEWCA